MQKEVLNTFTGGLNSDDEFSFLPQGDYRDMKFMRVLENLYNSSHAATSIFGNAPSASDANIPFGSLPIGWCEYPAIQGFIVFYFSTIGQHSIYMYNGETGDFDEVLLSSALDFKEGYYIGKNCKVINNDLLVWADGYFDSFLNTAGGLPRYHDVRCISISKALAGGYTSVTSQVLNLAKQPPVAQIQVAYADDATLSIDGLYRHQFRFRVQFVYDNGEESSWSYITQVPVPQGSEYWNGNKDTAYLNNTIEIEVPTGSYIVTAIRIAASVDGGPFGIFEEVNKADEGIGDDTFYTCVFTNTKAVLPISDSEPNYYDVPQSARTIEAMPSGVLAFGDYYREFDLIDPSVVCEYDITEITTVNRFMPQFGITPVGASTREYASQVETGLPYMAGDVIAITISGSSTPTTFSYSREVQVADFGVGTESQQHTNVLAAFWGAYNLACPASYQATVVPGFPKKWRISNLTLTAPSRCFAMRPTYAVPTLKTGTQRPIGIKYLDVVNRECAVITDPTMVMNILNPPEEDTSAFSDPNNPYYVTGKMTISHVPPEWATHWCPVSKDDGTLQAFMQTSAYEVLNDPLTPGLVRISLEKQYVVAFQGATYNYTPQVGDQVRFRTKSVLNAVTPNTNHEKVSETITMTVRKYDPVGGFNSSQAIWVDLFEWGTLLANTSNATGTGALLEIFRPSPADDNGLWYEIGEWQNVRFPHTASRAHEGNFQNQSGGTPAIQTLSYYDAWIRTRPMGVAIGAPPGLNWASYLVEDTRMSDYWDSDLTSRGRLAFYDINARRLHLESAVNHSFPLIQDTETNGLNKISLLTEQNLNSVYGAVTALTMSANTLVVNQERHSLAIYTDSVLAANPGAGDTVLASPAAFGNVRYYETQAGCLDPLTVVYENGSVFWLDRNNGQVIENAGGGLIPISKGEYKYNSEISPLCDAIRGATYDLVLGLFDRQYNEYKVVVNNTATSTAWTGAQYVFNRNKRRWVRKDPLPTAGGLSAGNSFFTFDHLTGLPYTENVGNYVSFYGVDYEYSVTFCVNPEPALNKQFLSMGIKSMFPMSVEAENAAGSNNMAAGAQTTGWTEDWWELIEQTYWTNIPYSVTTPGFTDIDEARLNGDPMEGFYLVVRLSGTNVSGQQVITFVATRYFVRAPMM
jgi:hypothetical protein